MLKTKHSLVPYGNPAQVLNMSRKANVHKSLGYI